MAGGEESVVENGGVPTELPAPQGWKKMVTPKKGSIPRGNEIVFVSPTGKEIKSRRQLNQYLKSQDGGPSVSEFDWSTGESPRRSKRLSGKSKATEMPESEPSQKRQNKSISKKGAERNEDDIDGEDEAAEEEKEEDAAGEDTKASVEVEMKDAEEREENSRGEVSVKEDDTDEATEKDPEPKTEVKVDETNILENQESADEKISDTKEEQDVNTSLPMQKQEESEEAEKLPAEPEAETEMENQEAVTETLPEADIKSDKESETDKAGQEVSTQKLVGDGETKPNDNLKGSGEEPKATDDHSASSRETSYKPQLSPVSC